MSDRAGNTKMLQTRPSACLLSREDNLEVGTQPTPTHTLTHPASKGLRGQQRSVPVEAGGSWLPLSWGEGGCKEGAAHYFALKNV